MQECPVCMERYRRLNSTACCHQDICECLHRLLPWVAADGAPLPAAPAHCAMHSSRDDCAELASTLCLQAPSASSAWW